MSKMVILGAGAFGISIAIMAAESGHSVIMWSAFESEVEAICRDREHKDKLPGVKIPEEIQFTSDISCIKSHLNFFLSPTTLYAETLIILFSASHHGQTDSSFP